MVGYLSKKPKLFWSNTLRPVVGADCLRIARGEVQGIASSALYWPADEVGSQTPSRLRPGDLSLRYTSCHIPSICFGRSPPRSCLVLYTKSWGRDELSRLGDPLEGLQEVVWATNKVDWAHRQVGSSSSRPDPLVGDGREPGRWGPGVPISHSFRLQISCMAPIVTL
jgi:hypothetical protein